VDIYFDENIHGFCKHQQFKLIADPYGFLVSTKYAYRLAKNAKIRRIFRVPIYDRLSKVHNTRKISDLDIITRFEIASPGDDQEQVELVDSYTQQFSVSY
jgi:hypothetical protein